MPFPTPWTVTVAEPVVGAKDERGNPVVTYAAPVEVAVYGWWPAQDSSEDFAPGRAAVTTDLEVGGPSEFSPSPAARITVLGETYTVVGRVSDYDHGPFGFHPGNVVRIKRIEEAAA